MLQKYHSLCRDRKELIPTLLVLLHITQTFIFLEPRARKALAAGDTGQPLFLAFHWLSVLFLFYWLSLQRGVLQTKREKRCYIRAVEGVGRNHVRLLLPFCWAAGPWCGWSHLSWEGCPVPLWQSCAPPRSSFPEDRNLVAWEHQYILG